MKKEKEGQVKNDERSKGENKNKDSRSNISKTETIVT